MGIKGKLYTLLKVKSDYGLSAAEKLLWRIVEDVKHDEYIRNLIELRDAGFIHEKSNGEPIAKRIHNITEKGIVYLKKLKVLYLKEISIKSLKWSLKHWYVALIAVLVGKCCS